MLKLKRITEGQINSVKNYLRATVSSLLLLLSLIIPALSGSSALAATAASSNNSGNGFRVSPPRYELTIAPGKSQTVSLFVENLANSKVIAEPIVNDFVAGNQENGTPELILDPAKSAPSNSFKPLVQSLTDTAIQPLERKEIRVTLHIPQNATPGGYYGAVRFQPIYTVSGPHNVSLTASVGTLFLITVPGNLHEKISLASFQATKNGKLGTFFNSGPITIVTRLKNDGNIHVQPFGKIIIKNTFGKIIYSTELNDSTPRGNILPGSIRRFENPIGLKHMFGRYTAIGNFAYGSNGDIVPAQKVFYVIPYVAIIIVILLLLFLIFVLPRLVRAYNRRVIAKAHAGQHSPHAHQSHHNNHQPPQPPVAPNFPS